MSAPEVIYLQWGDEEESPYWDETTWCAEKIGELDVKYILADSVNMAAPELLKALKYAKRMLNPIEHDTNYINEIIAKAEGKS